MRERRRGGGRGGGAVGEEEGRWERWVSSASDLLAFVGKG